MLTFLSGLLIGLLLSAPVGPMGGLAAFHAASKHIKAARLLALGVCLADALLAFLATWVSYITLPEKPLALVLGILMFALAWHLWRTRAHNKAPHHGASFAMGLGATLLHPGNIIAFALAFQWLGGLGVTIEGLPGQLLLTVGVFLGAMGMWELLIRASLRLGSTPQMGRFQVRFKQTLAILCALTGVWAFLSII